MLKESLRAMLEDLGVQQLRENASNFTGCCLCHSDTHASWGVNFAKEGHPWNCFSCGARGSSIRSFVKQVLDTSDAEADAYIRRFGELEDTDLQDSVLSAVLEYKPPPLYYLTSYPVLRSFRGHTKEFLEVTLLRKMPGGIAVPFFIDDQWLGFIQYRPNEQVRVIPQHGFQMKRNLYIPHVPRKKNIPLILVEGFTDALRVYFFGHKNVAALNGTSFTADQQRQVLALDPPEVWCMFDRDAGGEVALRNVWRRGLDVSLFCLGDYQAKDPDEMNQVGFDFAVTERRVVL